MWVDSLPSSPCYDAQCMSGLLPSTEPGSLAAVLLNSAVMGNQICHVRENATDVSRVEADGISGKANAASYVSLSPRDYHKRAIISSASALRHKNRLHSGSDDESLHVVGDKDKDLAEAVLGCGGELGTTATLTHRRQDVLALGHKDGCVELHSCEVPL